MKTLGYDSNEIEANLVVQAFDRHERGNHAYVLRFFLKDGVRREDRECAYIHNDVFVDVAIELSYDSYNQEWFAHTVERAAHGIAEVYAEMYRATLENVEKVRPVLKRWQSYIDKMEPRALRDYIEVAKKVYDTDRICVYEDYQPAVDEYAVMNKVAEVQNELRFKLRDIIEDNPEIATDIAMQFAHV